ncbi:response regulator [Gayadomonas joobiniege]|uniref:response regulator n=1 Tax=Gayadomonas joobiniege TaxID=1234606 RepID=UPI0003776B27|nr:response regulator [Gayadomonas joobiniege]
MSPNPVTYILLMLAYPAVGILLASTATSGQVVPIWLPAGIALSGCYFLGWRFLPAVFFGSASFNLYAQLSIDSEAIASVNVTLQAFLIAAGATMQAAVGSYVLSKIGSLTRASSEKQIITFICLPGFLVNIISASIGVFALTQFNDHYFIQDYFHYWLIWWAGDAMGVLITTPFLIFLLNKKQTGPYPLMVLFSCAFIFISITIFTLLFKQMNKDSARQIANRQMQIIESNLNQSLQMSLKQLHQVTAHVQNNPQLNRQAFETFVAETTAEDTATIAFSWNPIVATNELATFKNELEAIYQKPLTLKGNSVIAGDFHSYVKYLSNYETHHKVLGFNLASDPNRRHAMLAALKNEAPQATEVTMLSSGVTELPAYIIFAPVYEFFSEQNALNIRKNVIGFIATGVIAERVMQQSLQENKIKSLLYILKDTAADQVIASNLSERPDELNASWKTSNYQLAGRQWTLALKTNNSFVSNYHSNSFTVLLLFELVIVALAILIVLMSQNKHRLLDTMVKRRTRSLKKAKQKADEANLAKSRFLANMSHEIRTPLNAVSGFAQLASSTSDTDKIKSYLSKINLSSITLLTLINDILDISKIESDKLSLEAIPFDLTEILDRVRVLFEESAADKQNIWQVENQLGSQHYFIGDPLRVEQILINLTNNAIKFTHNGQVKLVARVIEQQQDKSLICLEVSDTGIGISAKNAEKLFNAFNQADNSTSRKYGGTGLGLTIVKQLCLMMQGEIIVRENKPQGCRFIAQIWLNNSQQKPQKIHLSRAQLSAGLKLLVAEDNEINQLVIAESLKLLKVNFDLANNGQEAVTMAQQNNYDAILMDCQMPVMDGYEATRTIRAFDSYIPIIALTADAMPEDKQRAFACGCNKHLSKPLDINELSHTLAECIENKV